MTTMPVTQVISVLDFYSLYPGLIFSSVLVLGECQSLWSVPDPMQSVVFLVPCYLDEAITPSHSESLALETWPK